MKAFLISILSLFVFCSAWSAERPKTYPLEFQSKFRQAATAFSKRDFDHALQFAQEADKVTPNTPIVWNLKGAIAIERGRYEEAEVALHHALEGDPTHYPAIFNLTEIPFRQKKYPEARAEMEKILANNPKNELVQYRIFLSYLFEKKDEQAKAALEKIVFPGNTPAYYYAHAAWALMHGDDKDAASWLKSSAYVFKPRQNEMFASSLREVKLLPELPPSPEPESP